MQVAERRKSLILDEEIPHEKSSVSQVVTISIGVGTVIPSDNDQPLGFVDFVDRLLYQAKQAGRNCIVM